MACAQTPGTGSMVIQEVASNLETGPKLAGRKMIFQNNTRSPLLLGRTDERIQWARGQFSRTPAAATHLIYHLVFLRSGVRIFFLFRSFSFPFAAGASPPTLNEDHPRSSPIRYHSQTGSVILLETPHVAIIFINWSAQRSVESRKNLGLTQNSKYYSCYILRLIFKKFIISTSLT